MINLFQYKLCIRQFSLKLLNTWSASLVPRLSWERTIPLNCFRKQGWGIGLGIASFLGSHKSLGTRLGQAGIYFQKHQQNVCGRINGEVLLVSLISCSTRLHGAHTRYVCMVLESYGANNLHCKMSLSHWYINFQWKLNPACYIVTIDSLYI